MEASSPTCPAPIAALPGVISGRPRVVVLLIVAIILMGLADLALTLTYMRGMGMIEANPIARYMLSIGHERQLILYKLASLGMCCGTLYLIRRHRKAEVCAWLCCGIMLVLSIHWTRYNLAMESMRREMAEVALQGGGDPWVTLAEQH
ncbi:MAG: hypothetical protein H6812_00525 [Phycisphaeraceae bacterium]|nr:hypothetical protein [Phycisphaerales bacterium]MCB9841720.1 hypothetical protein [Phycisphaeraceae bacterium]